MLAFLALSAAQAPAGAASSSVLIYLEGSEGNLELIASRTFDWEVGESLHLTVSADVIYARMDMRGLEKVASGLDVSGTRYWGNAGLTVGSRVRSDRSPRWYVMFAVYR